MRLIDADALIHSIKYEFWDWQTLNDITSTTVLKQTITDIENEPTIEAVLMVRCKDCALFYKVDGDINGRCGLYGDEIAIDSEWFCPNGRREL